LSGSANDPAGATAAELTARLLVVEEELSRMRAEFDDLTLLYQATIEHGEAVEDQLAESNLELQQTQRRLSEELTEAAHYIFSILPEPRKAAPRTDWLLRSALADHVPSRAWVCHGVLGAQIMRLQMKLYVKRMASQAITAAETGAGGSGGGGSHGVFIVFVLSSQSDCGVGGGKKGKRVNLQPLSGSNVNLWSSRLRNK
jgi:hypothetical protein